MKTQWKSIRVVTTCLAVGAATAAGALVAPATASAAPAKIPDGPANLTVMGGQISFGTVGRINQTLPHPDKPAECKDGVDNEGGTFHNGFTGISVGITNGTKIVTSAGGAFTAAMVGSNIFGTGFGTSNTIASFQSANQVTVSVNNTATATTTAYIGTFTNNPTINATDGFIDFGAGGSNENANTGCVNADDNLELFDRSSNVPDPAPFCGNDAAEGFTVTYPPGCAINGTTVLGDASSFVVGGAGPPAFGPVSMPASQAFGNNAPGGGQVRTPSTVAGTVAGATVTIPQAGVNFSKGYQANSSCAVQVAPANTLCLNLYVESSVLPQAGGLTGTTNADGSGTVSGAIRIGIKLNVTYDGKIARFFGQEVPRAAACSSSANINLNLTTGTSGPLTGVTYDDVRQNFKVVQNGITFPTFTGTNYSFGPQPGLTDLCLQLTNTIGLPDSTAQMSLILSTQATSNSAGSSASGDGMATTADLFRPAAVTQVSRNGTPVGGPQVADSNAAVDEGDVVKVDGAQSYDPAMRAFTSNTLTRTGGTAPAPVASTSTAANNITFVAQDAPAGGNTHVFDQAVTADLGPGNQTQRGVVTQTVTVNNVAPTANAGPAFLANTSQNFTLKGTSTDPGDPDTPAGRGYCWTLLGGGVAGAPVPPACTGSPAGNGKNLTLAAGSTAGSATYQLVVTDKDGGVSSPSTVVVNFRGTAANTISGIANLDDSPASGVMVNLYRTSTGFISSQVSGGGGTYSFAGLPVATDYLVQFSKVGATSEFYNRAANSGTATKIASANGSGVVDGFIYTNGGGTGTIATNVKDVGGNVAGTSVKVYDESGFVRGGTTDASGNATFANLPPKSTYRVRVALGDPNHAELWAVTGGNTAGTAGTGAWTGDAATKFTVSVGGTTNVNAYLYQNNVAANALGNVTGSTSGPGGVVNGAEVRLYDATSGAFVARATTGKLAAARAITSPNDGTFTFNANQTLYGSGTVLDPSEPFDQLGVRPGNYKIWFRNPSGITSGGNPVCSTWANGSTSSFLLGNQFQGTGKLVTSVTVAPGGTLSFGPVLLTTAPGCS
jgi:hypothetical protein